jgi:hypothetical protein
MFMGEVVYEIKCIRYQLFGIYCTWCIINIYVLETYSTPSNSFHLRVIYGQMNWACILITKNICEHISFVAKVFTDFWSSHESFIYL